MTQDKQVSQQSKRTVVEEGTHFKGDLTSTCPIDVRGRVEGDVQAPSLTVSAAGAVHGRAKVGSVRSEGELSGEFEADTIELSGTVKDKTVIRARSLEVKLSSTKGQQVLFGDCELSIGDEPTEHDAVEEPAAPEQTPALQVLAEEQSPLASAEAMTEAEQELADKDAAGRVQAATDSPDQADAEKAVDETDNVNEDPKTAADSENEPVAGSLEEALTSEADASKGKSKGGKGKRKNGVANAPEGGSGWTTPPSQPPPAQ